MLRHRSVGSSTRQVLSDTWLQDRYLLKRGAIVQIPSLVIHSDPSVWGPSVQDFDPRRFLKRDLASDRTKQHPGAFRAFGGGTTLCPGRHFASAEILAVAAIFALRYDLTPVAGAWNPTPDTRTTMIMAIANPPPDMEVDVMPRKGYECDRWEFCLTDSDLRVGMQIEGH